MAIFCCASHVLYTTWPGISLLAAAMQLSAISPAAERCSPVVWCSAAAKHCHAADNGFHALQDSFAELKVKEIKNGRYTTHTSAHA